MSHVVGDGLRDYPFTAAVIDGRERWALVDEDARDFLMKLPDNSIDSIVCDPPAGISLMNRSWDRFDTRDFNASTPRQNFVAFLSGVFTAALRVLKPGGHALVWALPRTSGWTAGALEDAGFETRERITHVFGTGYNKSQGLLKPAAEDWWLVRKRLDGTVKQNVAKWGVGQLNLDACRIPTADKLTRVLGKTTVSPSGWRSVNRSPIAGKDGGRVPANFMLSHDETCKRVEFEWHCTPSCPVALLDRQSGASKSRVGKPRKSQTPGDGWGMTKTGAEYNDQGGASRFFACFVPLDHDEQGPRFFYQAKPSRHEKEAGLDELPSRPKDAVYGDGLNSATKIRTEEQAVNGVDRGGAKNIHPCVKSITLARYLCRLVAPPNGIVLDPFAGSGSIGCAAVLEGFRFVGIEREPDYCRIATARIAYWEQQAAAPNAEQRKEAVL